MKEIYEAKIDSLEKQINHLISEIELNKTKAMKEKNIMEQNINSMQNKITKITNNNLDQYNKLKIDHKKEIDHRKEKYIEQIETFTSLRNKQEDDNTNKMKAEHLENINRIKAEHRNNLKI